MLSARVLMSTFFPSLKAVLLALHEGCYSEVHLVSCFLKLLSLQLCCLEGVLMLLQGWPSLTIELFVCYMERFLICSCVLQNVYGETVGGRGSMSRTTKGW